MFRILIISLLMLSSNPVLPFQGGGAVLGRVFEAGPNSPVGGATVTARNQENGNENSAVAAADGTFFISSLAPGMYTIVAEAPGFDASSVSGYPVRLPRTASAQSARISVSRIRAGRIQSFSNALPAETVIVQSGQNGSESLVEARVHWDAAPEIGASRALSQAQSAGTDVFSLIESRETLGPLPRQRMPEISKDQILIVITDAQDDQKGWLLIPDPRIIRAETPGPDGLLSGQVLYRPSAEFLVPVPRDLLPATLRIYQPRWTGKGFSLTLLGTLELR